MKSQLKRMLLMRILNVVSVPENTTEASVILHMYNEMHLIPVVEININLWVSLCYKEEKTTKEMAIYFGLRISVFLFKKPLQYQDKEFLSTQMSTKNELEKEENYYSCCCN